MTARWHGAPATIAAITLSAAPALPFATACYPSYSPPVRTGHYGAPAAPKPGRLEVGGAFYFDGPMGGGGFVDYALNDLVQLEAGADALDGTDSTFATGFAGVRVAPLNRLFAGRRVKLTLDVEGGGGAGAGGQHCWKEETSDGEEERDCDDISWKDRAAGGGYLGLGIGLNAAWFDLFARGRLQLTKAESAPTTLWSTALVGVQATIATRVKLYAGGGVYRYDDEQNSFWRWLFECGLSVFFDTMLAKDP
jgi:hypothetical protein